MSKLRAVLTQPTEVEEPKAPETDTILHGKHVLLVEDNELNQEIATAILEEEIQFVVFLKAEGFHRCFLRNW